jgi:hypothetical protein
MSNYVKIWASDLYADEDYISLPAVGRGLWLQFLALGKIRGDSGRISYRKVGDFSRELGLGDVRTLEKYITIFADFNWIKWEKTDQSFTIEITNYIKIQSLTPKEMRQRQLEKHRKILENSTTFPPQQSRAEQSRAKQSNSASAKSESELGLPTPPEEEAKTKRERDYRTAINDVVSTWMINKMPVYRDMIGGIPYKVHDVWLPYHPSPTEMKDLLDTFYYNCTDPVMVLKYMIAKGDVKGEQISKVRSEYSERTELPFSL